MNYSVGGKISGKTNKSVRPFSTDLNREIVFRISECWRLKLPGKEFIES